MIVNFKHLKQSISNKENIPSYILLGLLFFTQLFYSRIPTGALLNILLATGAIFLYNKKKLSTLVISAVYMTIILLYAGYLFLEYRYLVDAIFYISILWTIYTVLEYVSYENYVERLKERIVRILIAAVYFGIVYLSIYLIVTLLNSLLDAKIVYTSWPFRLSNAIASILGMLVLMYVDQKQEIKHSGFFKVIVGKILPILSIITIVLTITVIIRQMVSPINMGLLDAYYLYFGFIMLIYVLSEIAETDLRIRKILAICMAISLVFYAIYKFDKPGVLKYYIIINNLLIAGWLLNNLREHGKSDRKLSALVFIIALLLISPLFGYKFVNNYKNINAMTSKIENSYNRFKRGNNSLIPPLNQGEDKVYKNAYYFGNDIESSFDISKYNKVIRNVKFYTSSTKKTLENLQIQLADSGRIIVVKSTDKNKTEEYNIFEEVNLNGDDVKVHSYEGENYLIIIKSYMASEVDSFGGVDFQFNEMTIDVFY